MCFFCNVRTTHASDGCQICLRDQCGTKSLHSARDLLRPFHIVWLRWNVARTALLLWIRVMHRAIPTLTEITNHDHSTITAFFVFSLSCAHGHTHTYTLTHPHTLTLKRAQTYTVITVIATSNTYLRANFHKTNLCKYNSSAQFVCVHLKCYFVVTDTFANCQHIIIISFL